MKKILTTLGPMDNDQLGMILPHEHIFADLRTWKDPGYAEADTQEVVSVMAKEINKAQVWGVTAIVECSTVGVGRRADIDKAVSEATNFPLIIPTGIYREPWIPDWAHEASKEYLKEWMTKELQSEIENSEVQAGWIKLSAGEDGMTECEKKILRAASLAGILTHAVIGSHTVKGGVVLEQLDIIEGMGYTPNRFIWIHAQAEPDFKLHLEVAKRGAYIEYDGIGNGDTDDYYMNSITKMVNAGFENQLLISHDRGWYDPAQPGGGTPKPYTYINETFIPKLRKAGFNEEAVKKLTHTNPFNTFAR